MTAMSIVVVAPVINLSTASAVLTATPSTSIPVGMLSANDHDMGTASAVAAKFEEEGPHARRANRYALRFMRMNE